jgi:hypothetical protein
MDRGELWHSTFSTDLRLLERNLQGFTAELAAARPAPGLSSVAWLLGHLTAYRRGILRTLGAPLPEDPAWAEHYQRGGDGTSAHLPLEGLVAALMATDGPLGEAFLAVQDWDRPTLNPAVGAEWPLERVVSFAHMHESYHVGQVGFARKLQGLPGAL